MSNLLAEPRAWSPRQLCLLVKCYCLAYDLNNRDLRPYFQGKGVLHKYCREPSPKGLRGYGGRRTDKMEGSVLWSSHYMWQR